MSQSNPAGGPIVVETTSAFGVAFPRQRQFRARRRRDSGRMGRGARSSRAAFSSSTA